MVSARLYKQLKGKNWVWNVVLNSIVFPAPLGIVFGWVNTVAWNNGSTAAIPFTTIIMMCAIFLFVNFPLTVVGAITGRNCSEEYNPPCRATKVPREVSD